MNHLPWAAATGFALVFALVPTLAQTQGDADPAKSSACAQALARLEALQVDKAPAAATEQARQQASQACLRGPAPKQPPPRAVQTPAALLPLPLPLPAPAAQAMPPALPSAPLRIERPEAVSHCDPGGCWDSEGRRLNRVGQDVLGPRGGVCMPMGGTLWCP
ncbi:MAG TPA: hypothetical protein VLJ86_08855 [Ramlibacter sp.]|nr:hypothetical protein [Ramlibacter sp.]